MPYCKGLRANWKHDATMSDCIIPRRRLAGRFDQERKEPDGYTTDYRVNDDLLEHIRHIDNWSLGTEFADAFPWLAPFVRIQRST